MGRNDNVTHLKLNLQYKVCTSEREIIRVDAVGALMIIKSTANLIVVKWFKSCSQLAISNV